MFIELCIFPFFHFLPSSKLIYVSDFPNARFSTLSLSRHTISFINCSFTHNGKLAPCLCSAVVPCSANSPYSECSFITSLKFIMQFSTSPSVSSSFASVPPRRVVKQLSPQFAFLSVQPSLMPYQFNSGLSIASNNPGLGYCGYAALSMVMFGNFTHALDIRSQILAYWTSKSPGQKDQLLASIALIETPADIDGIPATVSNPLDDTYLPALRTTADSPHRSPWRAGP